MVVVKFISAVKDSVRMISSVWRLEGLGHWVTVKQNTKIDLWILLAHSLSRHWGQATTSSN